MGYESKIYIVNRNFFDKSWRGEPLKKPFVSALVLASYDLCKMGSDKWSAGFYATFKREIDYKIYVPSVDDEGKEVMEERDTDCYGEHMKSADLGELIEALKICEQHEHYRRIPPLIAMLEAFVEEKDQWNELQAVHYGY